MPPQGPALIPVLIFNPAGANWIFLSLTLALRTSLMLVSTFMMSTPQLLKNRTVPALTPVFTFNPRDTNRTGRSFALAVGTGSLVHVFTFMAILPW
jgi:hypothetical protein